MIATGHQPNLLPGMSVIGKIASADIFICCDEFQMVRHGWVNRQRLADGTPLTVPYDHRDRYAPINRVRIGNDARWRAKIAKTLRMEYAAAADPYIAIIERPWRLLVGLNVALLHRLLSDLAIRPEWVTQSHLATGRVYGPIVTDDPTELADVSKRLAAMTAEVGADVWLSGPTGKAYLDETPFHERGIEVRYFDWPEGAANPSAIERLRVRKELAA